MLKFSLKSQLGAFTMDAQAEIQDGITVIRGESGAGKSSLARMISGILTADTGSIIFKDSRFFDSEQGINIPAYNRRIGMIFQEPRLFPHMNVLKNLRYSERYVPKGQSWARIDDVLELLQIRHLKERRIAGLSGGEAQRVAIGRAIMMSPNMLIADEPLSALNPELKAEILPLFERLRDFYHIPILYITHSREEEARLADMSLTMEKGRFIST